MRFLLLIVVLGFYTTNADYHQSSVSVGVNFANISPYQSGHAMAESQTQDKTRNRRMYALCPPGFQRVGTECYSLIHQHSSWLEAHFFCKDKNSKLAEPKKFSDRKLREFLQKEDATTRANDPIWIGASYDWINKVWQWSITGHNLTQEAYTQIETKWSSRLCVDKHRFICQHKMPKVSEKNRYKVYSRWNATYPNQLANEVILEVIDRRSRIGSR
uniref:C-type lectin domain-containing protein n=1 Tax=Glossina morsitans morsitans TaxID=37546 RepID=A0A1B0G8I7_GLOMM